MRVGVCKTEVCDAGDLEKKILKIKKYGILTLEYL